MRDQPGHPARGTVVAVIDEAKIPIWSEIELAYHCSKGKLAAITGTKRKDNDDSAHRRDHEEVL